MGSGTEVSPQIFFNIQGINRFFESKWNIHGIW